jgi:NADH-quinone oxidoreductase subunit F
MTSLVTPELELSHVDCLVAEIGTGPESVIPILQAIQRQYHYLPQPALERVCQLTRITPADIEGVATFYTHFRHQPVGRHTIQVCQGTACHVKGAQLVQDAIAQHLKIPAGGDTDPRGEFTVQSVACLGCCTLAPVIQVDEATYGHVTPRNVARVITQALRAPRTSQVAAAPSRIPDLLKVRFGSGWAPVARRKAAGTCTTRSCPY